MFSSTHKLAFSSFRSSPNRVLFRIKNNFKSLYITKTFKYDYRNYTRTTTPKFSSNTFFNFSPYIPLNKHTQINSLCQKYNVGSKHYYSTGWTMPSSEVLSELQDLVSQINSEWTTWNATLDHFSKVRAGKQLLERFDKLLIKLRSSAPSPEDFEHHASVVGAPIPDNCHKIALIYAHQKAWDKALEVLERAIEIQPTNFEYLFTKAEILREAEKWKDAAETYTLLINSNTSKFEKPTNQTVKKTLDDRGPIFKHMQPLYKIEYPFGLLPELLYQRGYCLMKQSKLSDAMTDFNHLIKMVPHQRTAESWAWLGRIAAMHGKWEQSLQYYNKALEYNPQLLLALEDRQTANNVLGRTEDAKQDTKQLALLTHDAIWGISSDSHPIPPDDVEEYV